MNACILRPQIQGLEANSDKLTGLFFPQDLSAVLFVLLKKMFYLTDSK